VSYPGGHDPEADVCPACGQSCVHRELFSSANKSRPINRAKPSAGPEAIAAFSARRGRPRIVDANKVNKWRAVTYLNSDSYSKLLKLAGGRDISEVLREIVEARLEKETA
jgi:hypothetical protein